MSLCLFCKIANKEIVSRVVYEDDKILAFEDINPQAPFHVVVIPKQHIATLNDVRNESVYSDVFKAIGQITKNANLQERGYRVVANCNGDGGQTVFHLHFHVLGGRAFRWPPG
jgi:histidine triad (HIT) family protein